MLNRIYTVFQRDGLGGIISRIASEIRSPTTPITRNLLAGYHSFISTKKNHVDNDTLVAVYDLRVSSWGPSFDFAWFLLGAELAAQRQGLSKFEVWVMGDQMRPNPKNRNIDYEYVTRRENFLWRLWNILIPLTSLHSKCSGVSMLGSEANIKTLLKDRFVYPPNYNGITYTPTMDNVYNLASKATFEGLKAPEKGLEYIRAWLESHDIKRPIVTLTLRDYPYDTVRNSKIHDWINFAMYIRKKGFHPVFVPDTESAMAVKPELVEFTIFDAACWNLGLRISLYETAHLNVFANTGPAALAQLSKRANYIATCMVNEDSHQTKPQLFLERGMEIGQRHFFENFSDRYQVLSWKDDSENVLISEFEDFVAWHAKD